MPVYKALVTDKKTGKKIYIESSYHTKKMFICDLRGNGYAVDPSRVKNKREFDRIINKTNANEWDWKTRKYDLSKGHKRK